MPRKAVPVAESHPGLLLRWMGNVDPQESRTLDDVSIDARLICWWHCGKPTHEWFEARPGHHRHGFTGCPDCATERRDAARRLNATLVADVPELVAAWRDERSFHELRVEDLQWPHVARHPYSLRCPEGHKIDKVARAYLDLGCPWCRGNETRKRDKTSFAESDPELAARWHPTRNGDLSPSDVSSDYLEPVWWLSDQCCGHEWQDRIRDRQQGRRPQAGRGIYYCPPCESVFGSLAWLDPALAAEWHPDNELTAWHFKPYGGNVEGRWRCSVDPSHEWVESVVARSAGRLCPHCSTAGTSQIERLFLEAAQRIDPEAHAARLGRWRVDVLVPSIQLVIEYDGSYWHAEKSEVDSRKTRELLDGGLCVARIRENDLPDLALSHDRLRQVRFRPAFGNVEEVVSQLSAWALALREGFTSP